MIPSFKKYKTTDDYQRLKKAAFEAEPKGFAEANIRFKSTSVPNFYYYNTTKALGIIPAAEHSAIASTMGSGIHKLIGMIALYDDSNPREISLKDFLQNGCYPIQVEAAAAACEFLVAKGYTVIADNLKVHDGRSGLDLFIDLVLRKGKQDYAAEIKTVWAAKNETLNTLTDKTRTHREQALFAACLLNTEKRKRHGAITLHIVVPYTKNVNYVGISMMAYDPDEVDKVCDAISQ